MRIPKYGLQVHLTPCSDPHQTLGQCAARCSQCLAAASVTTADRAIVCAADVVAGVVPQYEAFRAPSASSHRQSPVWQRMLHVGHELAASAVTRARTLTCKIRLLICTLSSLRVAGWIASADACKDSMQQPRGAHVLHQRGFPAAECLQKHQMQPKVSIPESLDGFRHYAAVCVSCKTASVSLDVRVISRRTRSHSR